MTARRILIVQGHPDPDETRLCRAVAAAYRRGAEGAGHEVREIEVARLELPLLHTKQDWDDRPPPNDDLREAQRQLVWAEHVIFIYPLWLGTLPALLKAFLEQVFRPNIAALVSEGGSASGKGIFGAPLRGRSARVVVTMGMPTLAYRWWFRAHSLKNLEGLILKFVGISPVRETLIGSVESIGDSKRRRILERIEANGRKGA